MMSSEQWAAETGRAAAFEKMSYKLFGRLGFQCFWGAPEMDPNLRGVPCFLFLSLVSAWTQYVLVLLYFFVLPWFAC